MKYKIAIGEKKFEVEVGEVVEGLAQVTVNHQTYAVNIENYAEISGGRGNLARRTAPASPRQEASQPLDPGPAPAAKTASAPAAASGALAAPITGQIVKILVSVGDSVSSGQVVATLEAMKMENDLMCGTTGKVLEIKVKNGDQVAAGDVIMVIG